ncbi:MAG: insulinase family protein [Myxococcales bacterium]|nr:insulinase family protein [Myxococcales bacterium]
MANSWLGEHRNSASHLFQVIREKRGMNYGDYSYIEAFPQGGWRQMPPSNVGRRAQLFEVWIRTLPNDKAVFALRAALRELDALIERGMTPEEFELTRAFLRKYALHFADTTSSRLGYAIDDRFYGLDASHLERFRAVMDELTLEEVNAAIRTHLQSQNLKIAIVTGDPERLAKQLTSGQPTPITYDAPKPASVMAEDESIARYPLSIQPGDIRTVQVDEMFQR